MKQSKNYLLIAMSITIMILLLWKSCDNRKEISDNGKYRIDTLTTIHTDTIIVKDVKNVFKTITKFIPTLSIPDTNIMQQIAQNTYSDSICDTNECLYYKIGVKGELNSLDLAYKVKSHDSVFSTITNTIIKPEFHPTKFSLYGGIETGGNLTEFSISPFLTANYKRSSVTFRYGILDKTYNVGVAIKLLNSKK